MELFSDQIDNLIGGSADLTGSNNTKTKNMKVYNSSNYDGNYIYYGIREHGMASIINGIALHGGLRPYGGSFLVFSSTKETVLTVFSFSCFKILTAFSFCCFKIC